jgi:hypothetical protein
MSCPAAWLRRPFEETRSEPLSVVSFGLSIFLGAFLLFQVQPILGKYVLPWFGGGSSVWTVCLFFFQLWLLAGYTYSHLLTRWLSARHQVLFHCALLALSIVFLPITPSESWKPVSADDPTARVLALLIFSVGGPLLLACSTGPLIQRWRSVSTGGASPYRLYALSNLGSLIGLLTYPFIVEPMIGWPARPNQTVVGWLSAVHWQQPLVRTCGLCPASRGDTDVGQPPL